MNLLMGIITALEYRRISPLLLAHQTDLDAHLPKCVAVAGVMLAIAGLGGMTCFGCQMSDRTHLAGLKSTDLTAWVLETLQPVALEPPRTIPPRFWSPPPGTGQSVANRNSNPLNIKVGSETRRFLRRGLATVSNISAKDGGRFLKFDSPAIGFKAAIELLGTPVYDGLQVDRALRRWSNNGYGAEILGGHVDAQERVGNLGREDLRIILNAMAAAEGYKSRRITADITNAFPH